MSNQMTLGEMRGRENTIEGLRKYYKFLAIFIVKIRGNSNKIYRFYTTKLIPMNLYLFY